MLNILNFIAKVFRILVNVFLWLILIGCFIAGGRVFGDEEFSFGYAFLGLLIGLVIVVLFGGLIANFLNMVDNIETIKCHILKTGKTSSGSSSQNIENKNARWKCPKCNNDNPNTTYQCENCGYKLV